MVPPVELAGVCDSRVGLGGGVGLEQAEAPCGVWAVDEVFCECVEEDGGGLGLVLGEIDIYEPLECEWVGVVCFEHFTGPVFGVVYVAHFEEEVCGSEEFGGESDGFSGYDEECGASLVEGEHLIAEGAGVV